MRLQTITLVAALLLPLAASAGTDKPKPLEISEVVSQQQEIRADVVAGQGRYQDMPSHKRDELLRKQDALLRMLDGKQTADQLSAEQRMQAFNTLEWIEATINNEEDERMVCTREKTIGSNRVARVCKTTAQIEAEREQVRNNFDRGCSTGICIDR